MSSLSSTEKLWLERAFEMGDGYVLSFTNMSFKQFFSDFGVDIYDDRYKFHGNSKANRLRAFWDIETDELVGRVSIGLLELGEIHNRNSDSLRNGRSIAARLLGTSLEESHFDPLQVRNQEMDGTSGERQLKLLWGKGSLRVFISHISKYKKDAMAIKEELGTFGFASFVAHNDIQPSEEWQKEIERALDSMHFLIALLTEGFQNSDWTDQEIGFALARKVQVLPVDRGLIPYGFIGRYQALSWPGSDAFPVARRILEMALKKDDLKPFAISALIDAVLRADSEAQANRLSNILPRIDSLTFDQAEGFAHAYNSNVQANSAVHFRDRVSREIDRMTNNTYEVDDSGQLREVSDSEGILF